MRQPILTRSSLLAALAFAPSAGAVTMYVSPDGTATSGCYYDIPCNLDAAVKLTVPGDTVVLKDGIYKNQGIYPPANTQPATPAWTTFRADECALPILEGPGVGPLEDDQTSGMYTKDATYLRFVGLVARGWSSGFSNGYTDARYPTAAASNGHFEFENCIGDSNGRTGITFFTAEGIHIKNSITAHNGSSIRHSWSSGITLLYATGAGNLVEGNVSFENMDNHDESLDMHDPALPAPAPGRHSDGNGFIVDENSNGVTFINNIAFGNGGSCLRMTTSLATTFVNNTCYHNARDVRDYLPDNPGEVYWTNEPTWQNVTFMNNVFWATGVGPGAMALVNKPMTGVSNNVEGTMATTLFTAPEGANPDFTLAATATDLKGKGGTNAAVPMNDVGFDPKCIKKAVPTAIGAMAQGSWWEYSIDYDYIKSIGGVASCFNPGVRTTHDIGAYKDGAVATKPVQPCTPTIPPDHAGPPGGIAGAGTGGGAATAGSAATAGGSPTTAGAGPGAAGSAIGAVGGGGGGGAANAAAGSPAAPAAANESESGCGCRIGLDPSRSSVLAGIATLGVAMGLRRRRCSRAKR
jgi:hypothetical protein